MKVPALDSQIILTDWPKAKWIEANYRGMETEDLLKYRSRIYHLMMMDDSETAGGWVVNINLKGIIEELKFRKALPNDGWGDA
jgi:hypothetical protein